MGNKLVIAGALVQHSKYCTGLRNDLGPCGPRSLRCSSAIFGMLHSCWAITNTYLQLKAGKTILTQNLSSAVQSVERKLILIPIIFILLRIWSLLLAVITVEMNVHLNCFVVLFFLYIGVNIMC